MSKKNKIHSLVTGGSGFIGSEVTKQLLARGHRVTVFDNLTFGNKKNIWPGIKLIKGDLRSQEDLNKLFKTKFDQIYHLAAIHFIPYCNEHPDEAIQSNIEGTRLLLETSKKKPPQKLFFASTAAVYSTSSDFHEETEYPSPMDIYGITKLAGEYLVKNYAHETGINCAIGRLFNAYGPRETNPHLVPHILDQLKKGKTTLSLGNLKPYRDYIHIEDIARAILLLTNKASKKVPTANIASGDEYSVRQVVQHFERALGKKLKIQSKAGLRRKSERQHLRGSLKELKRLTGFRSKHTFPKGLRLLLQTEGLIEA